MALAACIERSNPFDPANLQSPGIADTQKRHKAALDSLVRIGTTAAAGLDNLTARFKSDSAANVRVVNSNLVIRQSNLGVEAGNARVETENAAVTDSALLQLKTPFATLDTLSRLGPYPDLDAGIDSLNFSINHILTLMGDVNNAAFPLRVYPVQYQDSVLKPLRDSLARFNGLAGSVRAGNDSVAEANREIAVYNGIRIEWNNAVEDFNSLVRFNRQIPRNGIITQADSLHKATLAARPGDTLLLGPGAMAGDLRFASGSVDSPIVIRGYPGRKTILRPRLNGSIPLNQAATLDTSNGGSYIRFQDVVFRGGAISGVKLGMSSRGVIFEGCLFDSSGSWGVDASNSDLKLINCEIRDNGGGIRYETGSCPGCRMDLQNVLIVRNRGLGVETAAAQGTISGSTISDNLLDGLRVTSHRRELVVASSILTGNGRVGVNRDPTPENQDGLKVEKCDVWGNGGSDSTNWSLVNLDPWRADSLESANFHIDPLFVNPQGYDYGISPDSDLAAYEKLPAPLTLIIGYRRKW